MCTFDNSFFTPHDATLSEEGSRRARKRLDEKITFIQDRISENTYYKEVYLAKHPEVERKTYEFYSTDHLSK